MEAEKLSLSDNKCHVIHVGSKWQNCQDFKVHKNKMHKSKSEKYLVVKEVQFKEENKKGHGRR